MPKAAAAKKDASASPLDRSTQKFIDGFTKTFGEDSISFASKPTKYDVVSTGSLLLDDALGVGGLVIGRLHEFWGVDGIGKTTMGIIAMAEAQRAYPDKYVGYIDAEHRADKPWLRVHGLDMDRCLMHTPNSAEEVADALKEMLRSGLFSVIMLDSIGAMTPQKEFDKDAGDATVGLQAKIVTRMVKLAAVEAERYHTGVVFLNQVRANIGYGADTTTGGGWALRHATTSKLRFRMGENRYSTKILGEDVQVGHQVAVLVERNGVAPAYKRAVVGLFNQSTAKYGPIGIDKADEAATLGVRRGLIEQGGAWYTITLTGEKLQGRESLVETLRAQPDVIEEIRLRVIEANATEVFDEEIKPEDIPVVEEEEPSKRRRSGGIKRGAAAVEAEQ